MNVNLNIKEARKKSGLKQAELAKLVGVSENYITQIETGRKKPSLGLIDAISDALSVKISTLLAGEAIIDRIREELLAEAIDSSV